MWYHRQNQGNVNTRKQLRDTKFENVSSTCSTEIEQRGWVLTSTSVNVMNTSVPENYKIIMSKLRMTRTKHVNRKDSHTDSFRFTIAINTMYVNHPYSSGKDKSMKGKRWWREKHPQNQFHKQYRSQLSSNSSFLATEGKKNTSFP